MTHYGFIRDNGRPGAELGLHSPFYCDYGTNIKLGDQVFFNFNCTILDVAAVTVGSRAVIGAGSVVTKNLPADVLATGNPCRVIRVLRPPATPGE